MKGTIIILSAILMGCSMPESKSTTEILSDMTPPIIVVGTGTVLGDCCIMVVDSKGIFEQIKTNAMCSVSRGDTLLF